MENICNFFPISSTCTIMRLNLLGTCNQTFQRCKRTDSALLVFVITLASLKELTAVSIDSFQDNRRQVILYVTEIYFKRAGVI